MTGSIEDKLAIQELIARYSHAIDSRDYDAWIDCFTEDGAFEGRVGRFAGRARLREFTEDFESRRHTMYPNVRHCATNTLTEIDGNTAQSSSYVQIIITDKEGARFAWCGRYEDTFVKVGGAWRFRERKVIRDYWRE